MELCRNDQSTPASFQNMIYTVMFKGHFFLMTNTGFKLQYDMISLYRRYSFNVNCVDRLSYHSSSRMSIFYLNLEYLIHDYYGQPAHGMWVLIAMTSTNVQTGLRICAVSPELFAAAKHNVRLVEEGSEMRPLSQLGSYACMFKHELTHKR